MVRNINRKREISGPADVFGPDPDADKATTPTGTAKAKPKAKPKAKAEPIDRHRVLRAADRRARLACTLDRDTIYLVKTTALAAGVPMSDMLEGIIRWALRDGHYDVAAHADEIRAIWG